MCVSVCARRQHKASVVGPPPSASVFFSLRVRGAPKKGRGGGGGGVWGGGGGRFLGGAAGVWVGGVGEEGGRALQERSECEEEK